MQHIKKLIEIPTLPEVWLHPLFLFPWLLLFLLSLQEPPNFLIGSFVDDLQLSQRVVVQEQHDPDDESSRGRSMTLDGTIIDLGSSISEEVMYYIHNYTYSVHVHVCHVCMHLVR